MRGRGSGPSLGEIRRLSLRGAGRPPRLMLCGKWAGVTKDPKLLGLNPQTCILPHPGDQTSEVKVSQGRAPSRGSRGGSFLLLAASGGSRLPWACGCLPPVSAFIFTWFLLCVWVSPLLWLRRTLPLDLGPPSSRRTSSHIHHFITSAEILFPNKVPFKGTSI